MTSSEISASPASAFGPGSAQDVRFWMNGEAVSISCSDPTETVLDLLRYRLRQTGSKEGCAEGDCGACTVVLGELSADGTLGWRAVNACILFVPMLDGRALITVEGLARDGALHRVQQEMVERHGSQCGFCTPGFVMALFARSIGALGMQGVPVAESISGNLCRCTGYGPILASGEATPFEALDEGAIAAELAEMQRGEALTIAGADGVNGSPRLWLAPRSLDELAEMRLACPDARILAGGTDIGLWVTKQHRQLGTVIWLGEVGELKVIEGGAEGLTLYAGVTYSQARTALGALHPDLDELLRRIAGPQVRNSGTIGGNIANGSPIGDMPPALIALSATVALRKGAERRTLPLEDYFIAYGKQDLREGEFLESVFVPTPSPETRISITKLSKRFASDITAVLGAFAVTLDGETVAEARLAFGGMAGIPQRAKAAEQVLKGTEWSEAAIEAAIAALAKDFAPLTDMRGSSAYRLQVAGNLLRRFWLSDQHPEEAFCVLELSDANG